MSLQPEVRSLRASNNPVFFFLVGLAIFGIALMTFSLLNQQSSSENPLINEGQLSSEQALEILRAEGIHIPEDQPYQTRPVQKPDSMNQEDLKSESEQELKADAKQEIDQLESQEEPEAAGSLEDNSQEDPPEIEVTEEEVEPEDAKEVIEEELPSLVPVLSSEGKAQENAKLEASPVSNEPRSTDLPPDEVENPKKPQITGFTMREGSGMSHNTPVHTFELPGSLIEQLKQKSNQTREAPTPEKKILTSSTQSEKAPSAVKPVATSTTRRYQAPAGAELRIWVTYNDEQFRIYRKLARQFEDKHNVKLRISRIPWHGQGEKLMYACNSRQAPDIARMDIGLIAKFAAGKSLLALDEMPGMNLLKKELLQAALESTQVRLPSQGIKTFGIPDEFTTLALFYNKDHFRQAGLDPTQPPRSWSEFLEYGKRLIQYDAQGTVSRYPFAMEITPWWSMPFLYSFGGKIIDDNSLDCKLTDDPAIHALEFQIELTRSKMEAGAWKSGALKPDAGFKNGKYSMILSGPWNLAQFRNSNVNYGLALIPGNPHLNIPSATNVGGNANVIFKNSKHPRLAFEFLKFLSSVTVQKQLFETLGAIPINNSLAKSGYKFDDPDMKLFIEQSQFAAPRPKIPGYDKIERIVVSEVETAFQGDRSPSEAYTQACEKIRSSVVNELKKYENK